MPPEPQQPHPLEALRRVLRVGAVGVAVAMPLAALVGWLVDGSAGLLGAVMGVLIPAVFFGITVLTALVTLRLSPGALGVVVLSSWVAKLILLIVALSLANQSDAWSRPVFGVTFLLAVVAWLGLEAWLVLRTRTPYVHPQQSSPQAEPSSPGSERSA